MKLNIPSGGIIYIDDNSDEAKAIAEGHAFTYDGEIHMGKKLTLREQVEHAETLEDIKRILFKLI